MTVPEAVDIAKKHLTGVMPEFADSPLQLEELETSPFSNKWRFTFTANLTPEANVHMSLSDVLRGRRISKAVEIDSETGTLLSVKNAVA